MSHRCLLAFALLVCLLSYAGCYSDDTSDTWPVLEVEPAEFSFGTIAEGQVVQAQFTLKNTGKRILRIIEILGNSALEAYALESELRAGESTTVKVRFDSTGFWGEQDARVIVLSNAPNQLKATLHLVGTVQSDYETDPRVVRVSRDPEKQALVGSTLFTNGSDRPMVVQRLYSNSERVVATFADPLKAPVTIAPGQSVIVHAQLQADLPRKGGMDQVLIEIKDRQRPVQIPVRIEIKK